MILASLKNFHSTYVEMIKLVLQNDKKELLTIAGTYLLSIAFFGAAFVVLLALIKSMVMSADFSLSKPLDIQLLGYQTSFPQLLGIGILLALYLLSSFTTYLVEKRWYRSIQKIVNGIVLDCSDANCKEVRVGAIATIRVGAILLATLSPALIALFAFILLVYFDWILASLTVTIAGAGVYLYLLLGRTTKRISTNMSSDEDEDFIESVDTLDVMTIESQGNQASERLRFISNLLQLKSKSRLIASVLFVFFIVGLLIYFTSMSHSADSAYRLIVSSGLIYLCFNGMKVVGSKAVPLSRQYNLVRDFISAAK